MPNLPSIKSVMRGNASKHLEEVLERRRDFATTPGALVELLAYENCDDERDYVILKGFIPKQLVGQITTGVGPPWRKSDTFFTDYASHYPSKNILSATADSLIICNNAAHDVRLYSSDVDPASTDKSASAGMSYMHLLVVPTSKVYNVVSLRNFDIVEEMQQHFQQFWKRLDSIEKVITAIHDTMERRYSDLVRLYKQADSTTSSERIAKLDDVMDTCRSSANAFASEVRRKRGDVVFGFHVHPHASVGHLHMHVLLEDARFREHSTDAHDWKTVSADVVRAALDREEKTNS